MRNNRTLAKAVIYQVKMQRLRSNYVFMQISLLKSNLIFKSLTFQQSWNPNCDSLNPNLNPEYGYGTRKQSLTTND